MLKNLKCDDKKSLLVLSEANKNVYLSARNLAKANVMVSADVNTYSILDAKYMVLTEKAVADLTASFNA
jgi:large subunit ribosomal protein L4